MLTSTSAAPANGSSDVDLLSFCEAHRRILVTADRATRIGAVKEHHRAGGETWRVLLVRPRSELARVIEDVTIILEASQAEEEKNVVQYIPFHLFA